MPSPSVHPAPAGPTREEEEEKAELAPSDETVEVKVVAGDAEAAPRQRKGHGKAGAPAKQTRGSDNWAGPKPGKCTRGWAWVHVVVVYPASPRNSLHPRSDV